MKESKFRVTLSLHSPYSTFFSQDHKDEQPTSKHKRHTQTKNMFGNPSATSRHPILMVIFLVSSTNIKQYVLYS